MGLRTLGLKLKQWKQEDQLNGRSWRQDEPVMQV
jgi:hypothetical protein